MLGGNIKQWRHGPAGVEILDQVPRESLPAKTIFEYWSEGSQRVSHATLSRKSFPDRKDNKQGFAWHLLGNKTGCNTWKGAGVAKNGGGVIMGPGHRGL